MIVVVGAIGLVLGVEVFGWVMDVLDRWTSRIPPRRDPPPP
jgi:putative effector of murein hydrolase LrgA (UPF0299 family)